jgi:hypothetical protein
VLEVGYVGSHGIHEEIPDHLNGAPFASAASPINCGYDGNASHCITTNAVSGFAGPADRSPYLGFLPTFTVAASTGSYKFNSLQATVRKSFSHGLTFQGAYTWSNALIASYVGNPVASLSDNVPVIEEYGLNPNYRPQRLVLNYSWELPFGHHEGIVEKLANGWTVSGVTTIQDGSPLTVTDSRGGSVFGSPVTSNAELSGTTAVLAPGSVQQKINAYFNTSAFSLVPNATSATVPGCTCAGTLFGNSGLGIARGPDQNDWDISLAKVTKVGGLREDASLQFRAEFFNAFNHPQFANPNNSTNGTVPFNSTTFGQISTMSVNPRFIQFGLKYLF